MGLSPNIRIYRYSPGQFFDAHCMCGGRCNRHTSHGLFFFLFPFSFFILLFARMVPPFPWHAVQSLGHATIVPDLPHTLVLLSIWSEMLDPAVPVHVLHRMADGIHAGSCQMMGRGL